MSFQSDYAILSNGDRHSIIVNKASSRVRNHQEFTILIPDAGWKQEAIRILEMYQVMEKENLARKEAEHLEYLATMEKPHVFIRSSPKTPNICWCLRSEEHELHIVEEVDGL